MLAWSFVSSPGRKKNNTDNSNDGEDNNDGNDDGNQQQQQQQQDDNAIPAAEVTSTPERRTATTTTTSSPTCSDDADATNPSVLKTEEETKYQGENNIMATMETTATTGLESDHHEQQQQQQHENEKKGVSFRNRVNFSPATTCVEVINDNNNKNKNDSKTNRHLIGPGKLLQQHIDSETNYTRSMKYIHEQGKANKTFKERQFPPTHIVRKMNKIDIESGMDTWRQMTATPRWDYKAPMNPIERQIEITKKFTNENYKNTNNNNNYNRDRDDVPQYRLHSRLTNRKFAIHRSEHYLITRYLHWTFRASFFSLIVTDFIAFFLICFIWACCIYAAALESPRCFVVAGTSLKDIDDFRKYFYFADAFQLSWTTFSTVGYGVVFPQVNKGAPYHPPDCFGFSFLIASESFVGVLFAAFCGSIIFGKIARIQSIASIVWSSPIVIRYGTGVSEPTPDQEDGDDNDEDDNNDSKDKDGTDDDIKIEANGNSTQIPNNKSTTSQKSNKTVRFPCPVLEFRVVNTLNHQKGGEIINASLNAFASTEAARAIESLQLSEDRQDNVTAAKLLRLSLSLSQKTGKVLRKTKNVTGKVATGAAQLTGRAILRSSEAASRKTGSIIQKVNRSIVRASHIGNSVHTDALETVSEMDGTDFGDDESESMPYNRAEAERHELQRQIAMASLAHIAASQKHIAVDEGSGLVPRRIFSELELETDSHPYFRRVWNCRHQLDANSPLLSLKAKKIIEQNHGKWPQEICTANFIRKNIHFHQIIVTLTGTHNSSGSDVFGMHVYDFSSVNIGYLLAKMLDINNEGRLYVDMDLLNDVREQRGGGAEKIRGFMVDEFGDEINESAEKESNNDVEATV